MSGTKELLTERLRIRKHQTRDAEVLFENFGQDPDMYRYSGWNPYATREMAEETVAGFIKSYDEPHFYGWAMLKCGMKRTGTDGKRHVFAYRRNA